MHPLPLCTSDFPALRRNGMIYADKTDLIHALAAGRSWIYLARPRCFGKSLLVSAFQSLFSEGLEHFSGLAIEKLWTDRQYNVVRLDFSRLRLFENSVQFDRNFQSVLISAFAPLGFEFRNVPERIAFFEHFRSWLMMLPPDSLVLLIDGCDAPLAAHLDDGRVLEVVRRHLNDFYAALRSAEHCLRFFFMTGVASFMNAGIFPALSGITDITRDPKYSSLLGLTEEELAFYFDDHLTRAEKELRINRDELLQRLRTCYGGYSFESEARRRVFCPRPVLNFLNAPEEGFLNYWFESGGKPKVLLNFLKKHNAGDPFFFNKTHRIRFSELTSARDLQSIGIEALLTQTGYLTIRSHLSDGRIKLGWPNKEVELSMAALYSDELLGGEILDPPGIPMLSELIEFGTLDDIARRFNDGFQFVDSRKFPIATEAACRASIELFLKGAAQMPDVESRTAPGQNGIEVRAGHRYWIFEFKFAAEPQEIQKLLERGKEEMLSRPYGEDSVKRELRRAVLVFNAETRRFEKWLEVDAGGD